MSLYNLKIISTLLVLFISYVKSNDFTVGMLEPGDTFVARDFVYKSSVPFGFTTLKYGRAFKCPITYVRVADRLGFGQAPHVRVLRGGVMQKLVVLSITSVYNQPVAVNVYVSCNKENKIAKGNLNQLGGDGELGDEEDEDSANSLTPRPAPVLEVDIKTIEHDYSTPLVHTVHFKCPWNAPNCCIRHINIDGVPLRADEFTNGEGKVSINIKEFTEDMLRMVGDVVAVFNINGRDRQQVILKLKKKA